MSYLQKNSPDTSNTSNTYSGIFLLESANFWIIILRATGNVKDFHSHQLVQKIKTEILELVAMINNSSITIHHLQDLLKRDDDFLHLYLNSVNNREVITKDTLVKVRQDCHSYEQRLKKLDDFYKRFCPLIKVKDVQSYLDELKERSKNLDKVSLEESLSKDHWDFHEKIILIAEDTHALNKSQTFYNVFEERFKDLYESNEDIGIEFIVQKLMKEVLEEYTIICKQYEKWEILKYSKEKSFWRNVSNFNYELKLIKNMARFL